MSNLREEITRTVLRLSRRRASSHGPLAHDGSVRPPTLRDGKRLGNYRILRRLGSGGMGHVYLALDTRLGRHVALKFLATETTDRSLLYRLQQEARTASALNHPNIVTVYEIGELDGEPFIASEFIDGATLRLAMQRKLIDIPTAIDVAIQVASALTAAHAAGVVHRDLKPGNIMLRPDGYVKVIDFGLAKQIQNSTGGSGDDFLTKPGSVIGTVDYMSPEQARGDRVDHRTDIWSLGVVLYEMVAERRPFAGQTDSHVIVSILDQPLPPLPNPDALPSALPRILECALAKDPAKRYSSVRDMLAALHQISPAPRSGSGVRLAAFERPHPNRGKIVSLASAALLLLLIAGLAWRWTHRPPDWFQIGSVRQLTFNGRTRWATISPDGNYLAFAVGDEGGEQTLYLKQADSSTEEVRIPPRRIDYVGLTFSPDSKSLFVTEKDNAMLGRLYVVPLLGAPPSDPLLQDIDGPVSFSPNSDQFAFVRFRPVQHAGREETESQIIIASRAGQESHPLLSLTDSLVYECVAWSPKGDRLAAILLTQSNRHTLDLIDLQGHESRRALPNWRYVGKPSWTPDAQSLILTAASPVQARTQLQIRQLALTDGQAHDITIGLAGYRAASLTQDGLRLAAVKLEARATVWVAPTENLSNGQTFLAEAEERPSLAWSDPDHLILNSERSGYPNLWLLDLRTEGGSSLTNEPYGQQGAVAPPGGKSIFFASNRAGRSNIWRFDRENSKHTQLTFGADFDEEPAISPDGRWVVYTSWRGNIQHLRKVPSFGGASVQIGSYVARDAQISSDGKWIACYALDPTSSSWGVVVVPFDGSGPPRRVPEARRPFRWSPSGNALTSVITTSSGVSNIWSTPLDGSGPSKQLTRFQDEIIPGFAWSPDGARIACLRMRLGADVALFKRQESR